MILTHVCNDDAYVSSLSHWEHFDSGGPVGCPSGLGLVTGAATDLKPPPVSGIKEEGGTFYIMRAGILSNQKMHAVKNTESVVQMTQFKSHIVQLLAYCPVMQRICDQWFEEDIDVRSPCS